jgi:hypothetical protein
VGDCAGGEVRVVIHVEGRPTLADGRESRVLRALRRWRETERVPGGSVAWLDRGQ